MQVMRGEKRLLNARLLGVFKMNTLDDRSRFKVHSIVECIRQYDFCFEVAELHESIEEVLAYFGIHVSLSMDERKLIIAELAGLAENFEVSEAVRWAYSDLPVLCLEGQGFGGVSYE